MKFYTLFRNFEQHFIERFSRVVCPYCSSSFYGVIFSKDMVSHYELEYVLEYFGVGDDYIIEVFNGCLSVQFRHSLIDKE